MTEQEQKVERIEVFATAQAIMSNRRGYMSRAVDIESVDVLEDGNVQVILSGANKKVVMTYGPKGQKISRRTETIEAKRLASFQAVGKGGQREFIAEEDKDGVIWLRFLKSNGKRGQGQRVFLKMTNQQALEALSNYAKHLGYSKVFSQPVAKAQGDTEEK